MAFDDLLLYFTTVSFAFGFFYIIVSNWEDGVVPARSADTLNDKHFIFILSAILCTSNKYIFRLLTGAFAINPDNSTSQL